jgi:hypothetical protein
MRRIGAGYVPPATIKGIEPLNQYVPIIGDRVEQVR